MTKEPDKKIRSALKRQLRIEFDDSVPKETQQMIHDLFQQRKMTFQLIDYWEP